MYLKVTEAEVIPIPTESHMAVLMVYTMVKNKPVSSPKPNVYCGNIFYFTKTNCNAVYSVMLLCVVTKAKIFCYY